MKKSKENKDFKWVVTRDKFLSQTKISEIIDTIKTGELKYMADTETSDVSVDINDSDLNNKLWKFIEISNKLYFKFNIDGIQGNKLFGKYYNEETFTESDFPHSDFAPGKNYTWDYLDTTTKLTALVFLNDGYEGGELRVWDTKIKPEVGKLVIFPSFAAHQVCKFEGDDRYVLIGWIQGDHFV